MPLDLARAVSITGDGRPALSLLRKYAYSTPTTATATIDEKADDDSEAKTKQATAALARLVEKRAATRKQAEQQHVVEMWQRVKERFGHFDWRLFMASLARNSEPGEDGEGDEH